MKQFVKRKHMKSFGIIALLALCLSAAAAFAQRPFRIENSGVVAHQVSYLSWTSLGEDCVYHIFRKYPGSAAYTPIAAIAQTQYYDTLGRTICADSVRYYIRAFPDTAASAILSDTVSLYHQDNVPTQPCQLRTCSVDTAQRRIKLSWYPSPAPDVMGYFILQGNPSRGYDTVWGRLNTTFLCHEELAGNLEESQFDFRILAFDSCYQASPLTPYYHNPILRWDPSQSPCSRHFHCEWNQYINMPDSVGYYTLYYKLDNQDLIHRHRVDPEGPFVFDTVISELSVSSVTAYLSVDNITDSLHALSLERTFTFPSIDLPEYLSISDAQFISDLPAIRLDIDVPNTFDGSDIQILRRQGPRGVFEPLDQLSIDVESAQQQYLDQDIRYAVPYYTYQLLAQDRCQLATLYSDTFQVVLPNVDDPEAFVPNALIFGHPDFGSFCPHLLSPLSDDYQLVIYNRMGIKVYETTNIADCWTGTAVDGQALPQGVYVYLIHCSHADGSVKKYKGTITLIK